MNGVIFLLSQTGGTAASGFGAPRNREGSKDEPSMLVEVLR
jgi:hypothetical protein